MEQIDDRLQYLRDSSANFRRLAHDYAAANHDPIAAKLIEVARDFEAKATALEGQKKARVA